MKYLCLISTVLLLSCGVSEIELPDGTQLLVVEGWVTNQEKQHWVKLSRTVPFDDNNSELAIEDAVVSINSEFISYPLTYSGNGIYLSDIFAGIESSNYQLNIELITGDLIQSEWEQLYPVSPLESIEVSFFDDQDPETGEDIVVYYPVGIWDDPLEETNYYRYIGYRNDVLLNDPNELILINDQFVNGADSLPHHMPELRYALGDEIKLELHSLSKSGFDFLELLKLQTTSLGSSSGTSPATLIGNLKNVTNENQIVLGFFGASSVSADSVLIN